jgi:hypothetical protein
MIGFLIPSLNKFTTVMLLLFIGVCAAPARVQAEDKTKAEATIFFSTEGPSPFVLSGTARHFGKFTCYGEFEFQPGEAEGALDGVGVAVLEAANGDLIVGVVSCRVDANGDGQIHFSWRDSVELSDGTVVGNTGPFQEHRPAGVVIAIIAILIG